MEGRPASGVDLLRLYLALKPTAKLHYFASEQRCKSLTKNNTKKLTVGSNGEIGVNGNSFWNCVCTGDDDDSFFVCVCGRSNGN